jgi:hypothetical protein
MIRMLCCYKFSINPQKFFGMLHNIAKNFCGFIENFSKQIIRSKILNRFLAINNNNTEIFKMNPAYKEI